MNTNKTDYVIVNGIKYFATGGIKDNDPSIFSKGDEVEYAERNTDNSEPSNDYGHSYYLKLDDDDLDGNGNGYHLNENGTNSRKAMFLQGRTNISNYLRENFDENLLKNKYGIDLTEWDEDTEKYGTLSKLDDGDEGFNNRNSRRVYYALADLFDNNMFRKQTKDIDKKWSFQDIKNGEKQAYNEIPLGKNITKSVATFSPIDGSYITEDEKNAIRKNPELRKELFYVDEKGNERLRDFSTFKDENDNIIFSVSKMSNPYDKSDGKSYRKRIGNSFFALNNKLEPIKISGVSQDYKDNKGFVKTNKYTDSTGRYISDYKLNNNGNYVLNNLVNRNGETFYYPELIGNRKAFGSDDKNQLFKYYSGIHAYGGPTTRLYAVGGTTGEQIPIGEQPDYNMVDAGGSHEQNPMGGVPYGMNTDGTQNMVEQGEVSVGNNVFSDRTAISPELCQQLGLPEGTSPAQAMQQIQALYEQGQIGDEEFQEIQQIIFDDQEAQKQNVGGSYQQGQVGGEGITPNMMQGQNMPPQAMPQQGASEGIAPEMVQGGAYAFGGRRRC